MMKIDRSNYEVWIIDWLDGNLNDIQVTQLYEFLGENPDLKEELAELELFRLKPADIQFTLKTRLQKSVEDISESQFEYLCAASIENDLSSDQQKELEQITAGNPERKKTFELIGKMRLTPIDVVYPNKKALYRRTVLQSAVRLTFIGLSAAAVIAIAFILYFTKTRELPVRFETTSQAIVNDSTARKNPVQEIQDKEAAGNPETVKKQFKNKVAPNHTYPESTVHLAESNILTADSSLNRNEILISEIRIEPDFRFKAEVPENLISLNFTPVRAAAGEERSKIGRFIAKTIREKFLREKTPEDSPLKGYEIAQASVAGINKLFGWEMALDERKDPEGNLKSLYFNSKLLKFNAPVKKSESLR
jgi:hypothetical protein